MQSVAPKAVNKFGPSTAYEKNAIKNTIDDQAIVDQDALYQHLYGRKNRKSEYVLSMEELSSLLETLLEDSHMDILQDIQAAFNFHASRRKQVAKEEMAQYWLEKVAIEVELHVTGLMTINEQNRPTRLEDTSSLNWYLSQSSQIKIFNDTLYEYLTAFIPRTIERLRSKYWLDDSEIAKAMHDLETSAFPDLPSLIQQLMNLNRLLRIPSILPPAALIDGKRKYLERMRDAMSGDASRLFLHLVVILWAVANDGTIYITGKSAPRLLKFLTEDVARKLSADDHRILAWVSTLKNKVKENVATEADCTAMRNLANHVVVEWAACNGSTDGGC